MVSLLLVSPRHGADVAAAEYQDFLHATGLTPQELTHRMLDSETASIGPLSSFDGVIVGGSPFNVTTAHYSTEQQHVHAQLATLIDAPIPVMFICFGASLVAHLKGGKVGRTHPEESSASIVELTPEAIADPLTASLPTHFEVLTGHTENVVALPSSATLLATGPNCPIQLYRANDTTWASQFHAEMDAAALETRMRFYFDYGYFSPEDFDSIVASIKTVDTRYSHQILRNFVAHCEELGRITSPRTDSPDHANTPAAIPAP